MIDIGELKGRQLLYARKAPQLLRALRAAAFVRGAESSGRMEGVTVAQDRLAPLAWGRVKPRNQAEREIRGYGRALTLIHDNNPEAEITTALLLKLHETVLEGAVEAGQWRTPKDRIDQSQGNESFTFNRRCDSTPDILAAVEELCSAYREVLEEREVHPLLAVAVLVFEFECLHPFGRGQTRVSRLLTLVALCHHGFVIGRFVSLERCFERSRHDYPQAVLARSVGRLEGKCDLNPWLEYFFGLIRGAYQEFEQRAGEFTSPRGAKTVLVEIAVDGFPSGFTFSELERTCPGVSRSVVERVLRQLKRNGLIERVDRGSSVTWRSVPGAPRQPFRHSTPDEASKAPSCGRK
jgi:Fic family protein